MKQAIHHPYLLLSLSFFVILFIISLFLPMFTLTKLLVFNNTFSIYSGIIGLLNNGQYILFVVLFMFTIILPIIKIIGLFSILLNIPAIKNSTLVKASIWLGKWSMLDVFAVAILLMSVKLGALANIIIHTGFYLFTISVLAMTTLTYLIKKYTYTNETAIEESSRD